MKFQNMLESINIISIFDVCKKSTFEKNEILEVDIY